MNYRVFTSESVSEGHPDKIADQTSDAILDALIAQDPNARVACETFVNTGMVLVGGEIKTTGWVDVEEVTRKTVREIGYDDPSMGFDWASCAVLSSIGKQSPDIARGVENEEGKVKGAGDQGMMFGYACTDTDVFMPAPITYAHRLMQRQAMLRKTAKLPWLRPDAKSQVTLRYHGLVPYAVDTVVVSTQHAPDIQQADIVEAVIEEIIKPIFPADWLLPDTRYFVNPTGRFVIGGPMGDSGLTGRKIIVDTYGGMARHGGGCFSGKDPSKVDRSAAYAARYVAKNLVAAGVADRLELQVSYAIGVAEPTSITVESFGSARVSDEKILAIIKQFFDLTPAGIISMLDLIRPIYRQTAAYGHFGRQDLDLSWERLDKVDLIRGSL